MKTFFVMLSLLTTLSLFHSCTSKSAPGDGSDTTKARHAAPEPDTLCTEEEIEISVSDEAFIIITEEIMNRFEDIDSSCIDTTIIVDRSTQRLSVIIPNEKLQAIQNQLKVNSRINVTSQEALRASRELSAQGGLSAADTELSSPDTTYGCYKVIYQDTSFNNSHMLSVCNNDSLCITRLDTIPNVINSPDKDCFDYDLSNTDLKDTREAIVVNSTAVFIGDNFFFFSEEVDCYYIFIDGNQICIVATSSI